MNTVHCILNNREISTSEHPATTVLDFVRRTAHLTGTKEGCREGDCGACTVLVGELQKNGEKPYLRYTSANSCLLPLGEMHGKHIVTVEGVTLAAESTENPSEPSLNLIQQAMADEGGTQCGFCTPGFIVSMTGYTLTAENLTSEGMISAVDGNVCRCTGYASIKRAIDRTVTALQDASASNGQRLPMLVKKGMLPAYFLMIPERLERIVENEKYSNGSIHATSGHDFTIGGGTDLFVQKHESLVKSGVRLLGTLSSAPHEPYEQDGYCVLDARTPVSAVLESPLINRHIPQIGSFLRLFASTPIRNRATLGGNINNASPIGDMTAILLALDAELTLHNTFDEKRTVMLRNYFKGYKTLDRRPDEIVHTIRFFLPDRHTLFNYEKVSRRTFLDIASVNTALQVRLEGDVITNAHASAGGVAPIPLYLTRTSSFLVGRTISADTFREAASIAVSETSPISDARGTVEYKRLLLRQLFFAHALDLFPERLNARELLETE